MKSFVAFTPTENGMHGMSDVHRTISVLEMSQFIFVIRLGQSFEVFLIRLDAELDPSDPLVKSGHQYPPVDWLHGFA
jgi:hypothetical protein